MPGKDRQRQLAREKVQRQMAKRAAEARRRRQMQAIAGSVVAVLAVLALSGFAAVKLGGEDKKKTPAAAVASTAPSATPSATPTKAPGECAYTKQPEGQGATPRKATAPSVANVAKTGSVVAVVDTNQGKLTVTLDRTKAPCTVNSFVSLTKQKYFDKTPCHRVTSSGFFVMQCGDPGGTGSGGPGYVFADEGLPADQGAPVPYPAGTVAMANSGPGTNGSQFFIVYKDTQFPPSYTIFGKVTAGLDTVVQIAANGTTPAGDGKPNKPVTINSVTVTG